MIWIFGRPQVKRENIGQVSPLRLLVNGTFVQLSLISPASLWKREEKLIYILIIYVYGYIGLLSIWYVVSTSLRLDLSI